MTNLKLVKEPSVEIKISAGVKPKNIDRQAPSYKPSTPTVALPTFWAYTSFHSRETISTSWSTPTTFEPPALNFVGTGFPQGTTIGIN